MSKMILAKIKCAVCGKKDEQIEMISFFSSGASDLDTRPNNPNFMSYGIQECPRCHYCNNNISVKSDKIDKRR